MPHPLPSLNSTTPFLSLRECGPLHIPGVAEDTKAFPPADLIRRVEDALQKAGYPALRRVEVEICAGVVLLWGKVPCYHQKQIAQSVAQSVAGVKSIANGLDVVCSR